MVRDDITTKVKESIATVTGLNTDQLLGSTSYEDDLRLDSISILEIVVDVECQFKIKISEALLGQVRTLDDTVNMVQECLNGSPV